MNKLITMLLLVLGAAPAFSADLAGIQKQLPALGAAAAGLPGPLTVPLVPQPQNESVDSLRAEALADPARFLDEHSPYEIGLAFGLQPSRFPVTDKKRIEGALVKLTVDLSKQRLEMKSGGAVKVFRISSGRPPENTTPGSGKCYAPDFMESMHYSSLYNSAPMPHSIFFNGNIAVHATAAEHLLGRPASHGCIRLSRADAKTVFAEVKAKGKANAIICVTGVTPKP
ncbi:MAG: L,D-transpeptidase [Elusimicrobiota bacterium]